MSGMIGAMIAVIIAGGSGTRLWPLSTPEYPKHLLSIADDKSLLRGTFERANKLTNKIYVATEASHAHHVKDQLGELSDEKFIIEPGRRGTANCIIAALSYLKTREDQDEPVVFLAADHFIRDVQGFVQSFRIASSVSKKENRIVLVGIEPDYPATGFGYIEKDGVFDDSQLVYDVDSFKEKPDYMTAQRYVRSGRYLWNCGYFVASINTFISKMQKFAPSLLANLEKLENAGKNRKNIYLGFKTDTIDYALIEKVEDLLVVPANFDWMDLGSYGDVHKAVQRDESDNHVHGKNVGVEGVENSYISNHEEKPVAVIGLDNVVVVNTPNGVLVARKDQSQKVKEILKKIEESKK